MDLRNEVAKTSPELCKQFGINRLALFGSVARGDEEDSSDIDFLAEFEDPRPENMPSRYFGFIEEASKRYNRNVQLLTPNMIRNPFLKRSINKDMIVVYE